MDIGYASIGSQEVDVFRGRELMYPYVTDYVTRQIIADGGTVEPLFATEYENVPLLARQEAECILVSGAYKTNKIYGVSPITGSIVPFTFSRAGTATYFDKNGVMQVAPVNMPRIDYDPITKVCRGYMVENAATNFSVNSNLSTVSSTNFTKTASSVLAPDGISTVFKFASTSATGNHFYTTTSTPVVPDNSFITISTFVKAAELSKVCIQGKTKTDLYPSAQFDLLTKSVSYISGNANSTAKIDEFADGWFRCSLTHNVLAGAAPLAYFITNVGITTVGDGISGVYHWGNQYEIGTSTTSYIPTTTSQVTRPPDFCISDSTIYSSVEGSAYAAFIPTSYQVNLGILSIIGSNGSNRVDARVVNGVSSLVNATGTGKSINIGISESSLLNKKNYLAVSYSSNGSKLSVNSSLVKTTAINVPIITSLQIGGIDRSMGNNLSGTIKSVAYFTRQLTDAEHISITT